MRLGIDLGTSRTVVAAVDRGNFPVVAFTDARGDAHESFPSISAEVSGALVHGLDARDAMLAGAPSRASWKRLLGLSGTQDSVAIGDLEISLLDLATSYLQALATTLRERSTLRVQPNERFEVVVAVPANAHSAQRFLTLEAFRRAGFEVKAMLNEPSAAGLEYAHRHAATLNRKREHVLVYDLGGGTFDAALVRMADGAHDVLATSGVSRLGGDDFDEALLDLALDIAGADLDRAHVPAVRAKLLDECRAAKESLHPSSKKILLDLVALGPNAPKSSIIVPVADYYDRVRPLVERSIGALDAVTTAQATDERASDDDIAGIYVVGGASGLPVVPRILRERFARRVHRSPYPSAATAIGLAIAAAEDRRTEVLERFTRHMGVFRERDGGSGVAFDGIFTKGTPMPTNGTPLVVTRRYRAAHNLGHYRIVECGELDAGGDPAGDITPHAELLFPFAKDLEGRWDLKQQAVERLPGVGPEIEERYEVDSSGLLAVTITNLEASYMRRYVLGSKA